MLFIWRHLFNNFTGFLSVSHSSAALSLRRLFLNRICSTVGFVTPKIFALAAMHMIHVTFCLLTRFHDAGLSNWMKCIKMLRFQHLFIFSGDLACTLGARNAISIHFDSTFRNLLIFSSDVVVPIFCVHSTKCRWALKYRFAIQNAREATTLAPK